ncbi:MAG TPA: hypothetical protein VND93_15035 [Myxococcales bacterium]|nr:hypothetical protein [Myxococcales bacterium]
MSKLERVLAEELRSLLEHAGVTAHVLDKGFLWQVNAGPAGSRRAVIHCLCVWSHHHDGAPTIGLMSAGERKRLGIPAELHPLPELTVVLFDQTDEAPANDWKERLRANEPGIASGKTRAAGEVVACVKAWLAGVGLEALMLESPFIVRRSRELHAFVEALPPRLQREIGGDPWFKMSISVDGRSCWTNGESDPATCFFSLDPELIASMRGPVGAVQAGIIAWLVDRVPAGVLAGLGAELKPHAEVLEADPARWHWLRMRDRLDDPKDVLRALRPLIQALAESPIATRFFCFSSLDRLCFSASSHYPWVREGLPIIQAANGGDAYRIQLEPDDFLRPVGGPDYRLSEAVERIEAVLAAAPVQPFFGSRPDPASP